MWSPAPEIEQIQYTRDLGQRSANLELVYSQCFLHQGRARSRSPTCAARHVRSRTVVTARSARLDLQDGIVRMW